jgi:hypothetical protein
VQDIEAREARAKEAYSVYVRALNTWESVEAPTWEDLAHEYKEAWRAAADAAYHHIVVSPST